MANEKCARCDVSGEKVMLYDAIYEGKSGVICERCAIIENIPVIKRPDVKQLKNSEKSIDVYDRMKRMSGYKGIKDEDVNLKKQRLIEIEKNPNLQMPEKEKLNLIEHFHWEIMKNRRRKGLSHKQLAEAISESEIALEMVEKGKLPGDAEVLIKKLEQFFQIRLRKVSLADELYIRKQKQTRTSPALLDEDGNELEHIPEPDIEPVNQDFEIEEKKTKKKGFFSRLFGKEEKAEETFEEVQEEPVFEVPAEKKEDIPESRYLQYRLKERQKNQPVEKRENPLNFDRDLDINSVDSGRVTINDLREMHKKKLEVSKQEQIEEKERIEEKRKLVEARKEELRMMKEKESKEIDKELGGSELLGKNDDFEKSVRDFDGI